jgi:GrpB-like predicted nucleotidyltransferase (UPF0157 family)
VRDYLCNNPQARDTYGLLKQRLANSPAHDITTHNFAYATGKQKLLADFLARATGRR